MLEVLIFYAFSPLLICGNWNKIYQLCKQLSNQLIQLCHSYMMSRERMSNC